MSRNPPKKVTHGESQIGVLLPARLHDALKDESRRKLISVSAIVRQLIAERLARERTVATRRR